MSKAQSASVQKSSGSVQQQQQSNGNSKKRPEYNEMPRREQIRFLLLQPKVVGTLQRAMPKGLETTPEKLLWSAITAIEKPNERGELPLYDCSDLSILRAVMQAAELGLEFGGAQADCWLLPYGGEATFQMAAYGYLTLAFRTGKIVKVWTDVIYEADEYDIIRGAHPDLVHRIGKTAHLPHDNVPYDATEKDYVAVEDGGRGRPLFAYVCAEDVDGRVHWDFVTEDSCSRARRVSRSPNSPAYKNWPDEMRKRTAITRARKVWPRGLSLLSRAIEIEEHNALNDQLEEALKEIKAITTQGTTVSTPASRQQDTLESVMEKRGLPEPTPSAREVLGDHAKPEHAAVATAGAEARR